MKLFFDDQQKALASEGLQRYATAANPRVT
jgi:hypothetical protein